jgi:hypothetical protein
MPTMVPATVRGAFPFFILVNPFLVMIMGPCLGAFYLAWNY